MTVLLISAAAFSQQSRMRKGPYLLYPDSCTQMTVLWQLENSDSCLIRWGLTPACTPGCFTTFETAQDDNGHQHSHTLKDLIPDQHYYYTVTENGVNHPGSFRTAPCGSAEPTSFFVYGDTQNSPDRHDSVMACIYHTVKGNPVLQTLLLHCGDWCSASAETMWDVEYFNRTAGNAVQVLSMLPVLGARGDHDGNTPIYKKYWPYTYETAEDCYYAFDYGILHIAVVDQYTDYSPGSKQLSWLENDLAQSRSPCTFILLHEPGFSDGGPAANDENVQTYIHPLCRKYGVRGVMAGHNHFYAHCIVDGIHYFTFGGGGGPTYTAAHEGIGLVKSEASLNFGRFILDAESMTVAVFNAEDSVIDSFSVRFGDMPRVRTVRKAGPAGVKVVQTMKTLMVETDGCRNTALSIVNTAGRTVLTVNAAATRTGVDLGACPSGLYFIRITAGETTVVKQFILH